MKVFFLVMIFLFLNGCPASALSDGAVSEAAAGITASATENIGRADGTFSFYDAVTRMSEGTYRADLRGVLKKTADMLLSELSDNARLMGAILLLAIVTSFLSHLEGRVTEAAFLCSYAVLCGIVATGFTEAVTLAKTAVSDLAVFVKSLVPVLTGMAVAEGKVITAPVMHTQVLIVASVASWVLEKAVLPLGTASFAIKFINQISASVSLGNLAKLTDTICRRLLSFLLLIVTATLSLTGFAAGTAETMKLKTARFAVSAFVPVAGGALSDTVSALSASANLLKNSIGTARIVAICLIAAYPAISCGAMSLLYSVTGAVIEPVADKRLSSAVTAVGECMGLLFAVVAAAAVVFIVSTAILLSAGV